MPNQIAFYPAVNSNSPSIVASAVVPGQTASIAFFTIYTPATTGVYQLCGGAVVTVAGSTGATIAAQSAWNTHGPALGSTVAATAVGADTASATNPCTTFLANAGSPIEISFTIGGSPTTNPTYTYWYVLTQL
jgi:hypothetical protein